ncbi:4-(cytidine 5'-diphospho)-2-C-methyl-D-erythritol kinase [Nocardioides pacificus]
MTAAVFAPVPVTVRAPAKINLHLGVGAPRPDGFHPLVTVYQAIGLHDDLTAASGQGLRIDVDPAPYVDAGAVPLDGANIAIRAARMLAAHHGIEPHAALSVTKAIPVAGGMAGGSADAAAALVALDRLWDLNTPDDALLRMAADLGSDVPFALVGGTALGTGRGEVVDPLTDEGPWWWVIVPSSAGLSTPEVYRHYDRLFPDASPEPAPARALLDALGSGDAGLLATTLHNDLQAPAIDLRPDLGELIARGEEAGALRGMVSGSGPTVVFLCSSGQHAREVAGVLETGSPVVLVANGPVAGAHLVRYS